MFHHITSWIYVAWFLYPRRSDCFCRSSTSFSSMSVFSFIHLDWYAVSIRLRVSEFRHFRVTGKKWGYFNVTLHLLSSYRNCDVKIQRVIINEKCVSIMFIQLMFDVQISNSLLFQMTLSGLRELLSAPLLWTKHMLCLHSGLIQSWFPNLKFLF